MKLFFPVVLMSFLFFSGCSTSGDVVTHVNCDGLVTDTLGTSDNARIFIPNAFTPNGDGLNEIFRPLTFNVDSIRFTIYDENNSVVFNSELLGDGWLAPPPTLPIKRYYYRIQATTSAHHKIGVCGDVYAVTCYTINPPRSFYYFEDMLTPNGFTGPTAETLSNCP